MNKRMTDEAWEMVEESACEAVFRARPACTCGDEYGDETIHTTSCAVYPNEIAINAALDEATRARASEDEKDAQIKALADALEAVHDWDNATREDPSGAHKSPMPQVNAALRLVGRL